MCLDGYDDVNGDASECVLACETSTADEVEPNDVRSAAHQITSCMTIQGSDSNLAGSSRDEDWFKIEVPDGVSSLAISLLDIGEGTSTSTDFLLYAGTSNDWIEYRVPVVGETAKVTTGVAEGDYFLVVRVANARSYELTVAFGNESYEREEANDIRSGAQLIESGVTYKGHDSASDTSSRENDWFKFVVTEVHSSVDVRLLDVGDATSTNSDVLLYVADSDEWIEYRIPIVGEAAELTTGVLPGEYFLLVRCSDQRAYELTVELGTESYEIEQANDVRAGAQLMESGTTYGGHDSATDTSSRENDWFKIEVEDETSLEVELRDLGDATSTNSDFLLYKAESDEWVEYRGPAVIESVAVMTGVTPGTYFIVVRCADQRAYEVTATLGTEHYETEESNDIRASAQAIELDTTYAGHDSLTDSSSREQDWFRVELPDGTATIELADMGQGVSTNTNAVLFDDAEAMLLSVPAVVSESTDASVGVSAGTHYIRVQVADQRAYTLRVTVDE